MSCNHCQMMSEYYSARNAQEERAESYSSGYSTEEKEFYSNVEERITFKSFLIKRKGSNEESTRSRS